MSTLEPIEDALLSIASSVADAHTKPHLATNLANSLSLMDTQATKWPEPSLCSFSSTTRGPCNGKKAAVFLPADDKITEPEPPNTGALLRSFVAAESALRLLRKQRMTQRSKTSTRSKTCSC